MGEENKDYIISSSMLSFFFKILWEFGELAFFYFLSFNALFYWIVPLIPNVHEVEQIIRRPHVKIVDNKGNEIGSYGDFYSQPIVLDKLPLYVKQALLDTEDRRFYSHGGYDLMGILRALVTNVSKGKVAQGGSTITQQLAKNFCISKGVFGPYDKSIKRKVFEMILSILLERLYTKDQILTFYLNRVYFGAGSFGISAAAERFFSKSAYELNMYEAARIVGAIQAPSMYSANRYRALKRADHVLDCMILQGHIDQTDKTAALILAKESFETKKQFNYKLSRYFTDWIMQCIPEYIYTKSKDIIVHSTLDPKIQQIAEKHAIEVMNTLGQEWGADTVALLSCDNSGAIRAMVGNANYSANQFNSVTQAYRQAGSAIKILVYLTALENGYTPESLVSDTPIEFGKWAPKNFLYKSTGDISLRKAFAKSVNTVSVRLGVAVKPKKIAETAQRFLFTSKMPNNFTIALGTGEVNMIEMLTPVIAIANQGELTVPHGINKIADVESGEVLYEYKNNEGHIVIAGKVVNQMLDLMTSCATSGTGWRAKFGDHPYAAKTGTSQWERDKWFVGFTAHLVTGVRFSTEKSEMTFHMGRSPSVTLWREFMKEVHSELDLAATELEKASEEQTLEKKEYKEMLGDIISGTFVSDFADSEKEFSSESEEELEGYGDQDSGDEEDLGSEKKSIGELDAEKFRNMRGEQLQYKEPEKSEKMSDADIVNNNDNDEFIWPTEEKKSEIEISKNEVLR